jgi:hypothetical protein
MHRRSVVDFARASAVLPIARPRLFAIPGVHAVGIGRKIVRDEITREPAIMVFVEHKTPFADLDPAHVIPAEIEGVKTDVYESEIPCYQTALDDDKERPLKGGIQLMPGCFITDDELNPPVYAVTNWHVVGSHTKVALDAATNLTWTPSGNSTAATRTFATGAGNPPVTPGTEILIAMIVGTTEVHAFYTTGKTDTATSVATQLRDAINGLGSRLGNGLSATAANGTLTVQLAGGTPVVQLAGPFSPTVGDKNASMKVTVYEGLRRKQESGIACCRV